MGCGGSKTQVESVAPAPESTEKPAEKVEKTEAPEAAPEPAPEAPKANQNSSETNSNHSVNSDSARSENSRRSSKEKKKQKEKEKEKAARDAQKPQKEPEARDEDIRDKYELGKVLGSGSFGQVREAKLKDSTEVRAVKMLEPDKGDGEWSNHAMFIREINLLQQIDHKNIIRYYDFYEDPHFLYVVMELCRGGEVFAKIVEVKRFSEKNAALLGQQMLSALDYIHGLHIAHRDIKAENFMLSEPSIHSNVKMIDFGMAIAFKPDQVLTELCGSPHYLAPELIGQKYNHSADVWAFGVLLYLLMYGHYPYDAKHPRDIMVKILTEPIKWQSKTKLSKEAIDLLNKLLEHDSKRRLTARQALEHAWMQKVNAPESDVALLNPEQLRSAHKKVTGTKRMVDPKLDELRNQKLQKIDEDYSKGVRVGHRLGDTPKEEFMNKPEFLRRENKITTAPSQQLSTLSTPMSMPQAKAQPRRLSYMPGITGQDETSLKRLFEEKPEGPTFIAVVPGGGAPERPQPLPLPAAVGDKDP